MESLDGVSGRVDTISRMFKNGLLATILGGALLLGTAAIAQRPERNISERRHPNLAAAQKLSQEAWDRIVQAQQANEWDMEGHCKKAKELLQEVNQELKQAAEAANRNKR